MTDYCCQHPHTHTHTK